MKTFLYPFKDWLRSSYIVKTSMDHSSEKLDYDLSYTINDSALYCAVDIVQNKSKDHGETWNIVVSGSDEIGFRSPDFTMREYAYRELMEMMCDHEIWSEELLKTEYNFTDW